MTSAQVIGAVPVAAQIASVKAESAAVKAAHVSAIAAFIIKVSNSVATLRRNNRCASRIIKQAQSPTATQAASAINQGPARAIKATQITLVAVFIKAAGVGLGDNAIAADQIIRALNTTTQIKAAIIIATNRPAASKAMILTSPNASIRTLTFFSRGVEYSIAARRYQVSGAIGSIILTGSTTQGTATSEAGIDILASTTAKVPAITTLSYLNPEITAASSASTNATASIPQTSSLITRSSITSTTSKHITQVTARNSLQIRINITILSRV
jgi:hypothetical protein